jgi:hypothetical protein
MARHILLPLALLLVAAAAAAATQRRVSGIITAVEDRSMTIAPPHGKKTVTGRLDDARTRVMVDGHPARVGDLKVTYDAKAELGLDDVWISVRAASQ